MRFLRYKALKSVMGSGRVGPGRAGPGREYSDFSLKYERTRSARCARSLVITSEREARSEFLLIYTKNLSMSGRPAGRGDAFERLISLEP